MQCFVRKGVAVDRLVGFQDLGAKDDFATRTLEVVLIKKGNELLSGSTCNLWYLAVLKTMYHFTGIISEKKNEDDEDDVYGESRRRTVRSSMNHDSDSD